ncbi:MAG TPA: hypothetical protein VFQ21_09475 [Gemmatimonadota bacterium]|nr:hypothetical protein [Gemmatimonadota bacterium]
MSRAPRLVPGQARTCPLCKATILESASVCPGCRHHLRFDPRAGPLEWASVVPLRVEGTIHRPADAETWEYSIVLAIRDERGEELTRQVLGVGAIKPAEGRTFELSVEVLRPVEEGSEVRQA